MSERREKTNFPKVAARWEFVRIFLSNDVEQMSVWSYMFQYGVVSRQISESYGIYDWCHVLDEFE
jgi:hypothetical protein